MNVLLIMEDVPITVTIQLVVIIVNVLLDIFFNLTIMIVKVNIEWNCCVHVNKYSTK